MLYMYIKNENVFLGLSFNEFEKQNKKKTSLCLFDACLCLHGKIFVLFRIGSCSYKIRIRKKNRKGNKDKIYLSKTLDFYI